MGNNRTKTFSGKVIRMEIVHDGPDRDLIVNYRVKYEEDNAEEDQNMAELLPLVLDIPSLISG